MIDVSISYYDDMGNRTGKQSTRIVVAKSQYHGGGTLVAEAKSASLYSCTPKISISFLYSVKVSLFGTRKAVWEITLTLIYVVFWDIFDYRITIDPRIKNHLMESY